MFDGNGGLVDVEPLKDRISTPSVRLAFENVLTPRIRSRLTLRMVDPSERDPRYSATVEVHVAPGDRWVVRTEAGLAHETFRPSGEGSFQAWWVGATVEFAVAERWHLWMRGRHYRDNGEIENTLSFSTAAPALETYEMLAGVRW